MKGKYLKLFIGILLGLPIYFYLPPFIKFLAFAATGHPNDTFIVLSAWAVVLFLATHSVLTFLYVWKGEKKYNRGKWIVFAVYVTLLFVPGNSCESENKRFGKITSCTCYGVEKIGGFGSECIGIRTQCMRHVNEDFTRELNPPEAFECK